ncbi:slipin family protein [Cellulomonas bogoriensis]|uniref:Band 7 domain-containing protein n=1 Tax=Cellulomonas bogoriensis 69B4 = DSM 16987 TaxID=1386082 RepID=A0A0A0C175_9CELL|nr:slipin family protein [Cellulomonas bogoriensis]KGM13692.1 hypothetical protein N869_11485 [Cellulomonas bogoriensis 69B4 = DSM 16987]
MRLVINEWERVLVYRDGRFEGELGAGRHRVRRWGRQAVRSVVRVAVRPRQMQVPLQEVLTGDGLSVKVSLTATVRVEAPRAWHEAVENPDAFVYTALQVALRESVAARSLDELLTDRAEVRTEVRDSVLEAAGTVGIVVQDVTLRDVVVPAELRRAAAQVATARAEGLAALERARSEVAATRALVNAARLLDSHPGLLQLRTLQAVEVGGATVVLNPDPTSSRPGA